MNEELHKELMMSEIKGYTKVVFNFKAVKYGNCYFIDHRCQLRVPVSVTKSVENFYDEGTKSIMWIKDWFYKKNETEIKLKFKREL